MRYERYDQVYVVCAVPKSQPIAYAQLAFYLHRLGDTDAVTATIEVYYSFMLFDTEMFITSSHLVVLSTST